ncbi:MAG: hypothetical protein A2408_00755 [Candidatus Yonathbacteria bacterium RIFOXYC1_FULL_52_10]|uniref:Type II secretion system protein GspI C-terminal domain-containing protein n=1 Tax=Candidatus Yonathbacteria bacterium RIFOXYD1_FULL_52_36 TaxID=1802730 RepID=A0A1G2SIG9_9BACT|nr:MAG: hypothetical protein A2408_00755 [Candidatus Yonathbacteria bacterium RIFOXYC1_FULL_52_10]OHA84835.1 MAG: hypothetical protein A2591_00695 [Candidatus Yonathbacteria bacterium RIFOXYD1_FULL_52_36]
MNKHDIQSSVQTKSSFSLRTPFAFFLQVRFFGKRSAAFSKGFTLVETLIAIAILVTAVLAPLAIAQSGIQAARYAQQQVTATFLAQSSLELVRYNIAYNLNTSNPNWLAGLDVCQTACEIISWQSKLDVGDELFRTCSGADPCRVYEIQGIYQVADNAASPITPYTRSLKVEETSDEREVKVTTNVSWKLSNGSTRTYTLSQYIYRWR